MTWLVHNAATLRVPKGSYGKDSPVYAALKDIPGCQPWHDYFTTVLVPASAAWIAENTLTQRGVPCQVDVPYRVREQLQEPDEEATVRRALAGGLYPWVVEGWQDDPDAAFIKPFQVQCIAFGDRRERALVVAEPGAGKTLVAIGWGCAGKETCPVVLNATIPTVVTQAADEWRRYADVEVIDLVAPSRRRKRDPSPRELIDKARASGKLAVLTVGWDVLRDTWDEISTALGDTPFAVIFDESQRAKQPRRLSWTMAEDGTPQAEDRANTSSVAALVARAASRVLETTATPVSNTVLDLWSQLDLLEPGGWGMTARRFRDRYCQTEANPYAPHAPHVRGIRASMKDELVGRMSFRVIQIPYDVSHAGLPPKRRELVRVRTVDQVKEQGGYNRKLRALDKAAAGGDKRASQQSIHVRLARAASRKRSFVVRDLTYRLDTGKGKVLVFCGWRKEAEELGRRLGAVVDKRGGQCWVGHGGDSQAARDQIRRDFLAHPGPAMLIGTWHAWGTGLNLDDVDVIAFTCLPFTPEQIAQSEGRGDRLSMTRPLTYVFYVAEGTADERVIDLLSDKLASVEDLTPGTRLVAMGGVRTTLEGAENMDAVIAASLAGMANDPLLLEDE